MQKIKINKNWNEVVKKNYYQILIVAASFLVMALASCFFVNGILRRRLLINAENTLLTVQANIRAAFAESEISLNSSLYYIKNMIEHGAGQGEILEYLRDDTALLRQNQRGSIGILGMYGYIRGEYIDGIDRYTGPDYIPQTRPWYQAAVRNGDKQSVVYTAPYPKWDTGETVITAVRTIIGSGGNFLGILAMDLNTEWLRNYITNIGLGNGSYGIIVSQNMTIMAHPGKGFPGLQLQELGKAFEDISRRLRIGEELSAQVYNDSKSGRIIVFFRQIFNGWYVGLITSTWAYYQELYYAAVMLSCLGFFLMCALSYLLLRINAARMKADEDNRSKSTFLAKMSHEIRTPMNAIIGMSELVLRENISPKTRNYIDSIYHAGHNLLAIINDILDFSKIESGKLDIINADYQLSSLINDVISIIRMRIQEKPILFAAKIDSSLPGILVGDEIRIRQILLNLLTNAVKYTKEGSITLTMGRVEVYREAETPGHEKNRIILSIAVTDTGIGIKKEDTEKLFENFAQFDTARNRSIEGTGLGLAITQNICRLMGGNIAVESVHGKGSTFTVHIPQGIREDRPLARVENPRSLSALIYDDRHVYADSMAYTLSSLGVNCETAFTAEDFAGRLRPVPRQFVFTSPAFYDQVDKIVQCREVKPVLVIMTEYGQSRISSAQEIFMPAYPVTVANVLNGHKADESIYEVKTSGVRFTAPDARILLVDDIATNLDVAEGLLAPYGMRIYRASEGAEAVSLIQKEQFDLVLMDHMMPGMDGIEAAGIIRVMDDGAYRTLPLVALTANAVSGMREMFLEKGFNDYLSKPIEIAKLNELLGRWIPLEKQVEGGISWETTDGTALSIPGVDTAQGLVLTGGTEAGYRKVLESFCKDLKERLPVFAGVPEEKYLASFIIHAHGIKSAARSIGAANVSAKAAALETAGKKGDFAAIGELLPLCYRELSELTDRIRGALERHGASLKEQGITNDGAESPDNSPLIAKILQLKNALENGEMREVDLLLNQIEQYPKPEEMTGILSDISDKISMVEYESAIDEIENIIKEVPECLLTQ
jgi:signal transduction histidine kinase/CheY-like chemotaxis protein